jgi:hypothetical protein
MSSLDMFLVIGMIVIVGALNRCSIESNIEYRIDELKECVCTEESK